MNIYQAEAFLRRVKFELPLLSAELMVAVERNLRLRRPFSFYMHLIKDKVMLVNQAGDINYPNTLMFWVNSHQYVAAHRGDDGEWKVRINERPMTSNVIVDENEASPIN